MHIPSLVKIHWCLLKLSSRNENMGVSRADNSIKNWRNSPISNPKPDLHNINTHTKFEENPVMFTQVIIQKRKTNGRTYDWLTDRRTDSHTDVQHETIIPRHYHALHEAVSFTYLYIKHPIDHLSVRNKSTAIYMNNIATGSLNMRSIYMEWIL